MNACHVDQGKKAEMQSTLKDKSKTHLEMLPESPALKVSVDAPEKVKPGTIETGLPMADQTGVQHARGERPATAGPHLSRTGKSRAG